MTVAPALRLLFVPVLLSLGCSMKPYRVYTPDPPTAAERLAFGRMSVATSADLPQVLIEPPKARVGPGIVGGAVGAGGGFGVGAMIALPAGIAAAPVFAAVAPFTIIGGAVAGATGGASLGWVSKEDHDAASAMRSWVHPDLLDPAAARQVMQWAAAQNRYSLAMQPPDISTLGSNTSPNDSSRTRFISQTTNSGTPPGIKTRIVLQITHVGLRIEKAREAVAFVALHTTLTDLSTGRSLYQSYLEYVSPPRDFNQWGAGAAKPLTDELQKGTIELARRSMYEIFEKMPEQK